MSFDKQKFAELLEKAKGNRSINHYAQKSGVTSAHISRLLRCLLDSPPTPQTIKKLADHAHNGVTYKDLMEAAGYIDDNTKTDLPELTEKDERDIQKELEKIIKGLKTGSGFAAFGGMDIDELDGGSITISYKALIFRRLSNISFCSVQNPCKIIFDSQIHAKQADRSALFFMMDKERAYSKRVGFVLLFQIVDSVLCFLRGEFFPVLGS